jgi:hypothetical protein
MRERNFWMIFGAITRKRRILERGGDTGDSGDIIIRIINNNAIDIDFINLLVSPQMSPLDEMIGDNNT